MTKTRWFRKLHFPLTLMVLQLCLISAKALQNRQADLSVDYALFKNPPAEFRGHAWLDFRLGNISNDIVDRMVDQAIQSNSYGGFMITSTGAKPGSSSNVVYLSDEYFRLYRLAI